MVNLIPWAKRRGELMGDFGVRPDIERVFDRMIDRFFGPESGGWEQMSRSFAPPMDISEEGNELVIRAELPGIDPNQVQIDVSGNQLTITGEKREESERKQGGMYRSECRYGSFYRAVELPSGIDADKVTAEYKNGVLELHIPRDQKQQSKRIPVNVGSGRAQTQPHGQGQSRGQMQQQQQTSAQTRPGSQGSTDVGRR